MRNPLLLAAAVTALLAGPAGARTAAPHISFLDTSPMSIRGQAFHAGERVRVTVWIGTTSASKTVTATPAGAFTARFSRIGVKRCGPYGARAVGDAGSKASLRVMPECPAPLTP